ncbi:MULTISPECIES: hypothetical protein [unclassified Bradyrhizobium]|uniref:hypothetical protein n=1 Tax=unclassified Bradyrhizobium TaxID=2631580 RepID=UPI001FF876D3|nr:MULTISPECIES: hypothetical protein [unclassified Bradyrhizobium]MCK1540351.1 hypothetical protein [Bradyrhizobium sp. 176]MCK1556193.1 hypothetical protein [Bradyrhizobium sp. 171]
MSAKLIDFLDVVKPIPVLDTKRHVIKSCGDNYHVQTTLDRQTRRGFMIVTEESSRQVVLARPCAQGDDPRIIDAAIAAWRAGVRRGRQQMCEEMELPS